MNVSFKPDASLPLLLANPGFEPDGEGGCPIREVLDRVGDTWSVLVVINLKAHPMRFNALRRAIEGISQRMLTVTLRSLERDGLVRRHVRPTLRPRWNIPSRNSASRWLCRSTRWEAGPRPIATRCAPRARLTTANRRVDIGRQLAYLAAQRRAHKARCCF